MLNNQEIAEEIKKEIRKSLETNDNKNTTMQNLWDAAKAVLRGKFITIQSYLKKQEKSQINSLTWNFPGGSMVKNLPANAWDTGSSPAVGRSHMSWSN